MLQDDHATLFQGLLKRAEIRKQQVQLIAGPVPVPRRNKTTEGLAAGHKARSMLKSV